MKLALMPKVTAHVTLAALAGALTLGAGGVALAQQAPAAPAVQADAGRHHHGHRDGVLARALALTSLTPPQRTAIEGLKQTRHSAEAPVKQADAKLLNDLAAQVEQASVDKQALAPDVQARDGAATAARSADRQTLQQLHDLLTPAQRGELVDAIEAGKVGDHAWKGGGRHEHLAHLEARLGLSDQQEAQIAAALATNHPGAAHDAGAWAQGAGRQAWLESFRADAFNATAGGPGAHAGHGGHPGEHLENLVQAMVPVLNPAQRADLAAHLRHRAAHESRA